MISAQPFKNIPVDFEPKVYSRKYTVQIFYLQKLAKIHIIKAKLILTVKELGQSLEQKKARVVAQAIASEDWGKRMIMIYSPTVGRSSATIMIGIAYG